MNAPLVSVILPVYNGEKFLEEAVASVLAQDYRPLEIVVVDDGSTDATAQVAAALADRIRYFPRPHAGPAAARNFGIRQARGEFVAFIDADDLWPDGKLRCQMDGFQAFPGTDIVQGPLRRITLPGRVEGRIVGAEIEFPFIYSNLGSMLVRRSVFDRIGFLDERLRFNEDTDFWLRAREAGIAFLLQRQLALIYRIHGRNLTTGQDLAGMGFFKVLRLSLERRRRTHGFVKPVQPLAFVPARVERNPADRPLVSVILTLVGSVEAERALASVQAQTYRPLELLVAGPGAGRLPVGQAGFERVERLELEMGEPAAALNAAAARSRGELLAFLDSESEWPSGKLADQAAHLQAHPTEGYVVGRTRQIVEPGLPYPAGLLDSLALRKNLGDLLGTLMVRREVFERVGGFDPARSGMLETDWLLRARDAGFPQKMLPQVCLYRFVRPDARMTDVQEMKAALLESVRASVRRKHHSANPGDQA